MSDLTTALQAQAPVLATLLNGPLAEFARSTVGRVVVGDDQATEKEIVEAITAKGPDADALLKDAEAAIVKELAEDHSDASQDAMKRDSATAADYMAWLAAEQERADKDRADARARQAGARDWWINPLLAMVVTFGFFAIIGYLLYASSSSSETGVDPVAQTLLGVLGTAWVSIITYYFGSSAGSKTKSAVIASELDKSTGGHHS